MLRIVPPEPPVASATSVEAPEDFEIVLGRRQVASVSFLACVVLVICCGGAYLAGKASAIIAVQAATTSQAAATPPKAAPAPVAAPPVTPVQAEAAAPESNIAGEQTSAASTTAADGGAIVKQAPVPADESSLFGEPVPGALYIQVGAVDRGPAVMLTYGLLSRGLPALIAPGPSNSYRVLVGPFRDTNAYKSAKDAVERMGITSFARTYQQ
jgi:cell division septation protein DedD